MPITQSVDPVTEVPPDTEATPVAEVLSSTTTRPVPAVLSVTKAPAPPPVPANAAPLLSGGLAGAPGGPATVASLVEAATRALAEAADERGGPLPARTPHQVADAVREALGTADGAAEGTARDVLVRLTRVLTAGAADPAHPRCAAHLHCPPLAVAVAADTVASVLNQSLDSWDQAPAATAMETQVVAELADLVGYRGRDAGGVVTSGGTESNLTALLLARDHALGDAGRRGVARAADGARPRVLCGRVAHFSVQRSAALLGLGEDAVVTVDVDSQHRMRPAALRETLLRLRSEGDLPVAVVATAGTTDLGGIDPLGAVARVTREFGVWLHVDAAYGGGLLFSRRLRGLLAGLERADSVSLDLHKLGWQPVAAGILLTRERALFAPLSRSVDYLNPTDDEEAGYPSLLGYSLRTTRRADVFKIAVTLRALGADGLGRLVDACRDLTLRTASHVLTEPRLVLAASPSLTTVVFRYDAGAHSDTVNAQLRRRLLEEGRAVVGRTRINGRVWLKLTLLNPDTTAEDTAALLAEVVAAGDTEAAALKESR
ncbi:pyridoxal phosphate-dependent decarboxylase family protein [Nocardiopsis alborubida]|uniref:Aspartate aminotransferase family protein n=1 Tax=Nocardiopsis alborubida TaxID=146802 RepID=A0A7X6MHH1_9ACTN|nr:aspartate aminotransferase family protein [Nocardiopsis alborubida]NKZ00610.1 aspartate aminotransferase family protein [Nocardiopsis alborubida]